MTFKDAAEFFVVRAHPFIAATQQSRPTRMSRSFSNFGNVAHEQ